MSRTDIDDTVRDMWATRPRRRSTDKKIAGVAAAIARRYQIDPTLVRIGFVVATIYGGVGIMLYLLGWLLLPVDDDQVSPAEALLGRGQSSMSVLLTCLLGLLLIPASLAVFSGAPSHLVGIAIAGTALFLLHRHRGGPVAATSGPPIGAGMTDQPTVTSPLGSATVGATTPTQGAVSDAEPPPHAAQQNPPAWDPLGVAPFAWDLPEPAPEPPPEPPAPKHRSAVTPVTIGLALVVGGIGAVAAMYDDFIGAPQAAAMVLAVLGGGLVVGSFVRGGRGLIWLAVPLAIATWIMSSVPFENVGNREYKFSSAAQVQPNYQMTAGNLELDFSELTLADTQTVTTQVEMHAFGNMEVKVSEDVDVQATCSASVGNVECLNAEANGANPSQTVTDYGDDGEGRGGRLVLELVHHGTGNVELKR